MRHSPHQDFLSPELLNSIQDYSLLARIAVEGLRSGMHRSTAQGTGTDFLQYRNYSPGDDLKLLDWKLLARQNRLCIRTFEEETDMQCIILLDASSSMAYQGKNAPCSKIRYASILAACLAGLCEHQSDRSALFAYSDHLHAAVSGSGSAHLQQIFALLASLKTSGTAVSPPAFQQIGNCLKNKGLVILLSDACYPSAHLGQFLQKLHGGGHDCLLCQILDQDELRFPFQQTLRFIDSETEEDITVTGKLAHGDYMAAFQAFLEEVRQTCMKYDADYLLLDTSQSLQIPLTAWLSHRKEKLR